MGAYWDDDLRGAAYVFVRSGTTWTEEQKLVAGDGCAAIGSAALSRSAPIGP